MRRRIRGSVLLEVICALTILAIGGLGMMAAVHQGTRVLRVAHAVEAEQEEAGQVLAATTLLDRAALNQRLGSHLVGAFAVEISRPTRDLFRIAVSSGRAGGNPVLTTVVYRPAVPSEQ